MTLPIQPPQATSEEVKELLQEMEERCNPKRQTGGEALFLEKEGLKILSYIRFLEEEVKDERHAKALLSINHQIQDEGNTFNAKEAARVREENEVLRREHREMREFLLKENTIGFSDDLEAQKERTKILFSLTLKP